LFFINVYREIVKKYYYKVADIDINLYYLENLCLDDDRYH